MLKQSPGSNAADVIENVKEELEQIKKETFPPGMDYELAYDVSKFLDASIDKVADTLLEAFILVSLVVDMFLGDVRSTLIPVIAVPVSLIGTFFVLKLMGTSINLITLFALVLAIGVVVDDAIVVVEAVHAKMAAKHLSPDRATMEVLHEISGAIIAITLVMTSVFVPVTFMPGPIGTFYREFGITMATSINKKAIQAEFLTANARQLQSLYNYQRVVLNAYTEVLNRVSMADNYRKSLRIKRQQLDALEESVDVATRLFQNAGPSTRKCCSPSGT